MPRRVADKPALDPAIVNPRIELAISENTSPAVALDSLSTLTTGVRFWAWEAIEANAP